MTINLYEDLLDGIDEELGDFLDQIGEEIRRIAGFLNDAASGVSGFFDDILPGDTVDRAIERWNNEIHPWIMDMCDQVQENVWDAIGDLAGRPQNLIDYAGHFSSVKATIYQEGDLAQKMVIFDHDWQGYAADNYRTIATTENDALRDLSLAMDAGATLTTTVATRILTLWREIASQFAGWVGDLIGCFKVATEADSIITFEIPAAFELAKAIWENIVELAEIFVDFLIEQATTAATSWQQLASGARGLPQNHWPMVQEANSDVMNDPDNWTPQPA